MAPEATKKKRSKAPKAAPAPPQSDGGGPLFVRYVMAGPLLTEDGKPRGGVSPGFVEESPTVATLFRVGHVRITPEQYEAAPRKVPKR